MHTRCSVFRSSSGEKAAANFQSPQPSIHLNGTPAFVLCATHCLQKCRPSLRFHCDSAAVLLEVHEPAATEDTGRGMFGLNGRPVHLLPSQSFQQLLWPFGSTLHVKIAGKWSVDQQILSTGYARRGHVAGSRIRAWLLLTRCAVIAKPGGALSSAPDACGVCPATRSLSAT